MFNLLPQEEKQGVSHEYRLRLAGTWLFFLAAVCVIAAISLLPSLFLSYRTEQEAILKVSTLEKEIGLSAPEVLTNDFALGNKKISALASANPTEYFYELVGEIVDDKTSGIKISAIDITRADGGYDININGKAVGREALLSFVRTLESEKNFTNVTVPVSSFAPVVNIDFSILVKAK